jgi:uncharacterized protein YcsI (UPF0317 family)
VIYREDGRRTGVITTQTRPVPSFAPSFRLDHTMTLTQYPDALSVRVACRRGAHKSHTAGLAPRHLQANLLIIPKAYATDFRRLCQRNPVACPLLAESPAPGNVGFAKHIAKDIDIRFDAPAYNMYVGGTRHPGLSQL